MERQRRRQNLRNEKGSAYPLIETIEGKQRITIFDVDGRIMRTPTLWLTKAEHKDSSLALHARNICYVADGMQACEIFPMLPFDDKLQIMNREHVQKYVNYELVKMNHEQTTAHSREMTLFNLLTFMSESDGELHRDLKDGPYRANKKITNGRYCHLPKELSEEQIIAILKNCHNECERCVLHFIFDCGPRIEQVIKLTNRSLPLEVAADSGYLPMQLAANKQKKGHARDQVTLISTPVLARIERYHNNDVAYKKRYASRHSETNLVFLSANGRPWTRQNLTQQMRRAASRAGLNLEAPRHFDNGTGKKRHVQISPHVLRHSFACNVLRSIDMGADYMERRILLMQCLCHSSLKSGEPYATMVPRRSVESKDNHFSKYEQAKRIDFETFIAPRKHLERRGHVAA
ncbi:tyrosine-type recombinase/integrase [Paraburkholderia sp. BR10937]|uniref:tyrosine-type recombinase/integrase n=1 Tax=Paraburkholderia sp. BR10937 TaxID=3236994 RepID=UPI0034D160AD